ncbi:S-layer homology domain-containing protein [uncultured Oscillibacter sp.]|uniref:S-layer homology domain-containing protein n=1 Tax=uncultured Oscillibacter sp. TaxID=876091 RepID=UPI0025D4DD77|nr:S-layer homology domain-containing protein [uncultured Oscillibacter sp.]
MLERWCGKLVALGKAHPNLRRPLAALMHGGAAVRDGAKVLAHRLIPAGKRLGAGLSMACREAAAHWKETGGAIAGGSRRFYRSYREHLRPLVKTRGREVFHTSRQWCLNHLQAALAWGGELGGSLARRAAHGAGGVAQSLRRRAPRRAVAMALALCMTLSLLPVSALGAEAQGCDHVHDERCGYVEAPCDQGCTDTDGDGVADHAPGCAAEGRPCRHELGEHDESCGYREAVEGAPCAHTEHDERCGYVEAAAGSPCTHAHDETCGGLADTPDGADAPSEQTECPCAAEPDADGVTAHRPDCPLYTAPEVQETFAITALEGGPEAVLTAVEGQTDALALPDTISGVCAPGETPSADPDGSGGAYGAVDIPVTWSGLPNPAVKGEYTLAAAFDLPDGYVLADGVAAPIVALTLTADPDVEAARELLAALPAPAEVAALMAKEDPTEEEYALMDRWAEDAQAAADAYGALTAGQQSLLPGAQAALDALLSAFRGNAVTLATQATEGVDYTISGTHVNVMTEAGLRWALENTAFYTINVTKNITFSSTIQSTDYTTPGNDLTFTLNLSGNTLTYTGSGTGLDIYLSLRTGSTDRVTFCVTNGTITSSSRDGAALRVTEKGTLVLSDVKIRSTGGGERSIALYTGAKEGTKLNSGATVSATGGGTAIQHDTDVATLSLASGSKVTSESGTGILLSLGAVDISGGSVTTVGGTAVKINATWAYATPLTLKSGTVSAATGTAIHAGAYSVVDLQGGTVSATTGTAIRITDNTTIPIAAGSGEEYIKSVVFVKSGAMVTSANTGNGTDPSGTIYVPKLTGTFRTAVSVEGGTVQNTAALAGTPDGKGWALYFGAREVTTENKETYYSKTSGTLGGVYARTPVYVAQVGAEKYESLSSAINAAKGQAVVVLQDHTMDTPCAPYANDVTIDLDGYTVTWATASKYGISHDGTGGLTIMSSKAGGVLQSTAGSGMIQSAAGTVTVKENATVTSDTSSASGGTICFSGAGTNTGTPRLTVETGGGVTNTGTRSDTPDGKGWALYLSAATGATAQDVAGYYTVQPGGTLGSVYPTPGYIATVDLQKDDKVWADSGKTLALYKNGEKKYDLAGSGSTFTASVVSGTYDVYFDGRPTGLQVTNETPVTVDCYTVAYSAGAGELLPGASLPAADVVLKGGDHTVSTQYPVTRPGHTQTGWSQSGILSNVTAPVELTPVWKLNAAGVSVSATYGGASANGAVYNGGDLTFAAAVTPPLSTGVTVSYQWYDGPDQIAGAMGSTYTISQADAGAYGPYRCVVTCSLDGLTSTAEASSPTVTIQPKTENVTIAVTLGGALTYNGTLQTQTIEKVTADGAEIPAGSYQATGNTGMNAGTDYSLTVTIIAGNYKGAAASVRWSIEKAVPTAGDFLFTRPGDLTYSGAEKTASVSVGNGVMGMGEITAVRGAAQTDVGTATISIDVAEGTNYQAVNNLTDGGWTFAITPKAYGDGTGFTVETIADQPFTGAAITPEPVIQFGGKALVKGTDFEETLTYENNVNVGNKAASVTVTFKGNYSGTAAVPFSIYYRTLPTDIGNDTIFTLSGAELMEWHKDDIVLAAKDGWTVGTDAAGLGTSVTLSIESTKVNGTIVPSHAALFVRDGEGHIYQTAVDYLLDQTMPVIVVDGMDAEGVNKIWDSEKTIAIHITDALSGVRYLNIVGQDYTSMVEYGDPSMDPSYRPIPDDGTITYTVKANDVYTITAYDNAGNQPLWNGELPTFVVEKIDGEKPTAAFGEITGALGQNGWFTGTVTVNVRAEDPETIPDDPDTIAINESNKSGVAKWEYSLDGGKNWTEMAADATSFPVDASGDYTDLLQLRATDHAGNVSETATASAKLDKTKPTIESVAGNPMAWTQGPAAITFTAADTPSGVAAVTVSCDDGQGVTYTNGGFTADRNGTYTITVTDHAGNTDTKTVAVTKLDPYIPAKPIVTGYTSGVWVKETISFSLSTTDTVPSGTKFQVKAGDAAWADVSGSTYTVTENTDGVIYSFRAISGAGTAGETADFTVKLDKTVPVVSLDVQAGGAAYDGTTFTAHDVVITSGNTAENISGVTYYYRKTGDADWTELAGNALTVNYNCDTAFTFKAVSGAWADSSNQPTARVKRSAMNDEELAGTAYGEGDFTVSPAPNGDGWYNEPPTVTVTPKETVGEGGLPATTYYELYKSPASSGTKAKLTTPWQIKPDSDGIWTLDIWTEDEAGNHTKAYRITIRVDTAAPTIRDVAGVPAAWTEKSAAITFTAADATSGVKGVTVSGGSYAAETVLTGTEGAYTFTADRNGPYTITVTDHAGNSATETVAVTKIDKAAPVVSWAAATAALNPNKWYGRTSLTAAATDDSGETPAITLISGGKPYENGYTLSATGSYTFTAAAKDGAGNVGRSAALTVRIETAIDDFAAMMDALDGGSSYQDILDAKTWHDGQSQTVKDRFSKSDDAQAAYEKLMGLLREKAQEAAGGVTDAIRNADTIEEIEQAAKDYDALPDEAKAKVPGDAKEELAQKKQDAEAARKVIEQLADADRDQNGKDPGGSYEEKKAAQEAYNKLTEDQKALVDQAASAVADKNSIDADLSGIDRVLDLPGKIKKPYTPATKDQIKAAEDAYDALTQKQKDAFPKADKAKLDALETMREHAQAVEDRIKNLGEDATLEQLTGAKGAYDSLTADERAMVDGADELNRQYQAKLDQMSADEKAAAEFAAKVEAVKQSPTVEKIEQLIKDHDALSDAAKGKLTDQTKQDYQDLMDDRNKAKEVIDKLDGIHVGNLTPGDMDDVKDALGKYDKLDEGQKQLVDEATGGKPGVLDEAVKGAEDATGKIEGIPDHGNSSTTTLPGGDTVPNLGDCENDGNAGAGNTGTGGHTYEEHKAAIEEAKIAYEKLTDAGRKLISDAAKEKLNREYAALMSYLEYIHTARTAATNVEVAGLAEKVELPTESTGAPKTVISVVMADSRPETMPPVPAGKTEALSVDIKLVASIYEDPDATATDTPIAQELVQPKAGEAVLVKLRVPSGYRNDTLELWHIKDNGGRSRVEDFWLVTESDGTYAVFEVNSFSHFVFFAEKESTGGGGGGTVTSPAPKPDVTDSDHGSATISPQQPRPGTTVTIRPEPDEGYVVDEVVVTDRNGKEISVKDRGDGTWSYTQPNGKVTVTVTFKPQPQAADWPFADVKPGDWFYESVRHVYERGLMNGTTSDRFSPYLNTSRGMIVTILWRLEGEPEPATANPFPDVAADAYCAKAVAWGAENGIVKGYGDGNFGPNGPITREQLAAILYRFAQFKNADVSASGTLSAFTDAAEVSGYAQEAVKWAVDSGIITGKANRVLDPTGKATRAEAAVMLQRFNEMNTR